MECTKYKKIAGISFIAFFSLYLIDIIASKIFFSKSSLFTYGQWWLVISSVLEAIALFFIIFKAKSSIIAKIGGALYAVLILICITNNLAFIFTGNMLIYYNGITEYIHPLLLFGPGLLLITWGSKLWLPAKITFSICIVLQVIRSVVGSIIVKSYINNDLTLEDFNKVDFINSLGGALLFNLLLTTLILAIIWCVSKKTTINNAELNTADCK